MKYYLIPLLICLQLPLGAQVLSSFGADFTRSVTADSLVEQSSGKLRIQFPDDVMVFVSSPVKQWLHYSREQLLIYYPEEEKLFRLDRPSTQAPPFISAVMAAIREDFGLSELGFTIGSSSARGDTLRICWQAPDSLQQAIGKVELQYLGRQLTSSRSYDIRDSLVLANRYDGHFDHRGYQIPLRISLWQKTGQGEKREEIVYSDPVFDQDYSALLLQFRLLEQRIPDGER